jgi:uncharacterized protein YutE (UPF0331/DUF86 family)
MNVKIPVIERCMQILEKGGMFEVKYQYMHEAPFPHPNYVVRVYYKVDRSCIWEYASIREKGERAGPFLKRVKEEASKKFIYEVAAMGLQYMHVTLPTKV